MVIGTHPTYAGEFNDVLDGSGSKQLYDSPEEINLIYCNVKSSSLLESSGSVLSDHCQKLLHIENLTLQTPINKAVLLMDLSLVINCKEHLLVSECIVLNSEIISQVQACRHRRC